MAPPDLVFFVAWAALIFFVVSGISFVALAWRFLQRKSLSLPIRLLATAIVAGLVAAYAVFLVTAHDSLIVQWLSIAVTFGVLVWVAWFILWLVGPRGE